MTPFKYAFYSLAVWRLTVLLVYDTITAPLRDAIGVKYDAFSNPYGSNIVAEALTCHRCTSVWAAMAITLFFVRPSIRDIIPTVLALSGGSVILVRLVNGE